jgi:CBS domain-containing protein
LLDARIPLGGQREYREILRRVMALTAREIMTEGVKVVTADTDLEEVATLMVEDKANPVPVLENGHLVGIISHSDLIQHLEEANEPARN